VGKGEHKVDGTYLIVRSSMNVGGHLDVPKKKIVVAGGIEINLQ